MASADRVAPSAPERAAFAARERWILAIVLASYFMIVLDISIVITGLPKIQAGLGFSTPQLSWIQSAYTLTFGGFLLLGARAGDLLGRRRMFLFGLAIFTAASIAIGLAQSPIWLASARAVQGIGAAVLAPSTLALLTTNFEGPLRTRAVAYYGAAAGIGASVGLVVGGILADLVSWRAGFFINFPIGIVLAAGAIRFISESERRTGQFDVLGAIASTLGMAAIVYGLVHAAEKGWRDTLTIGSLGLGMALVAAFLLIEWRARQPIMPLRLFASRERSGAYLARVLFLGGMVGFWFFSTQLLQEVLGLRPLEAGLAFLPLTIVNFATAMAVPRLTKALGSVRLLALAFFVSVAGMAWLSRIPSHPSYLVNVAPPMVLIGAGQGGALAPLTSLGVAGVAREDAGAASGLVNVAHQLGGALGLSVLVVVFASAHTMAVDAEGVLSERIAFALLGATILLAIGFVVCLTLMLKARVVQDAPPVAPSE